MRVAMRLSEIVPSKSVERADEVTYLSDVCACTENRVESKRSEQRVWSGLILILVAAIAAVALFASMMPHR